MGSRAGIDVTCGDTERRKVGFERLEDVNHMNRGIVSGDHEGVREYRHAFLRGPMIDHEGRFDLDSIWHIHKCSGVGEGGVKCQKLVGSEVGLLCEQPGLDQIGMLADRLKQRLENDALRFKGGINGIECREMVVREYHPAADLLHQI
ncbi:MAG: hypothetical protein BWY82_02520 [Verrucomicrobia bacterium ADurb.Bin474]|nr:MAG: hypothetical protein BWY82_02520 [Verrucomicrobia bacterium ADurb.Bin474]